MLWKGTSIGSFESAMRAVPFGRKRSHSRKSTASIEFCRSGHYCLRICSGKAAKSSFLHGRQTRQRITQATDKRAGHWTTAMRRRHEDHPCHAGISSENRGFAPTYEFLRIPLQLIGRKPKDALPNAIPARAYQRVRNHSSHAVSKHDGALTGRVAVLRIKRPESLVGLSLNASAFARTGVPLA